MGPFDTKFYENINNRNFNKRKTLQIYLFIKAIRKNSQ